MIAVDVLDEGGFDCATCQCVNGVLKEPIRILDLDYETRACPIRQLTPFTWQIIDYHRHYKAGHLPFSGSVYDQPAHIMRAISIVEKRIRHNEALRKKHA